MSDELSSKLNQVPSNVKGLVLTILDVYGKNGSGENSRIKIKEEKPSPPPRKSKRNKRQYRTKAGHSRESSEEELPKAYSSVKTHKAKHKTHKAKHKKVRHFSRHLF